MLVVVVAALARDSLLALSGGDHRRLFGLELRFPFSFVVTRIFHRDNPVTFFPLRVFISILRGRNRIRPYFRVYKYACFPARAARGIYIFYMALLRVEWFLVKISDARKVLSSK